MKLIDLNSSVLEVISHCIRRRMDFACCYESLSRTEIFSAKCASLTKDNLIRDVSVDEAMKTDSL